MSQVNEHDNATPHQVGRGSGHCAADLREPSRAQAPGRAIHRGSGAGPVRHPASRPGNAGAAWPDDARRAGRSREGAAAIHDQGDRGPGGTRPGQAGAARYRPAAGRADRDRAGPGGRRAVAAAAGGLAGIAAARADAGGAGGAAGGSTDTGEAQPVLTSKPRWGSRTFSSLKTRNYRLFAAGQVVSNTGSWMQRVAQDWLVLQLSHDSGTALGITTGLQFLPLLLFSLWGGVIADRYAKRSILMVTQAVMGALALILGILALTGTVRIWHVYLLAFGLGLATVVDNPTRQAFAVEMVGTDGMANAIALNSAVFNLARIAGPAVAGLVIGIAGTPAAFLVNAASYGAVLVGLKLMRPEELHKVHRPQRARGQLREALSYVRSRPDLSLPMILLFFVATFGMNFQVTLALMSRTVFHTGASAFGFASAVFAFGALGGALLAARQSRPTLGLLLATSMAFSVLEIITGIMPDYLSFLAALVPTGLTLLTFTTAANSRTQLRTTPDMRGRVMGLYLLLFLGGTPLVSPMVGWVAQTFGARMSVVAGGVISGVATIVIGFLLARKRGVPVRSYLRADELVR